MPMRRSEAAQDLRLKVGLGWSNFRGLSLLLPLPTQGDLVSCQGLFFSVLDFAQNTDKFLKTPDCCIVLCGAHKAQVTAEGLKCG